MSRRAHAGLLCYGMLITAGLAQLGADFNVTEIDAPHAATEVFLAQVDPDPAPELVVLSGHTLTVLHDLRNGTLTTVQLPQGTSAVDLVDTDGDGAAELYAAVGIDIQRRALDGTDDNAAPQVLFSKASLLSASPAVPRPYVLVTTWEGNAAIALPMRDGMGLFAFDGERIGTAPFRSPPVDPPLNAWNVSPAQIGAADALEIRADAIWDAPPLSFDGGGEALHRQPSRRGTLRQVRDAAALPAEQWPWFALRPGEDSNDRVLYALAGTDRAETMIRIQRIEGRDLPGGKSAFYVSPKRRYPGMLVAPDGTPPDFNGDGFADLLLWSRPQPGTSVDSLMRAAQARTWPIRLAVHVFSPDRALYAARPSTRLDVRVPVGWSLIATDGLPFRHLVLSDVNADGHTDIALSNDPTAYGLWLYEPGKGFDGKAFFEVHLPERIRAVALHSGQGITSDTLFALRGEKTLYILSLP